MEMVVSIAGCQVAGDGTAHTLTSRSYLDTNHRASHDKVVPVSTGLEGLGQSITYAFPPHSLTCLEIGMQKSSAPSP